MHAQVTCVSFRDHGLGCTGSNELHQYYTAVPGIMYHSVRKNDDHFNIYDNTECPYIYGQRGTC